MEEFDHKSKRKNDDKPKGRPHSPVLLVVLKMIAWAMTALAVIALVMSVLTMMGAPSNSGKSSPPITSYEVQTYTQQTTTFTTSKTIITSSSRIASDGKNSSRLNDYLASLLQSLERAMQTRSTTSE